MSKGLLFWVLFILCVIFGCFIYWPNGGARPWPLVSNVVEYVLIGLLGWQVFGAAVK